MTRVLSFFALFVLATTACGLTSTVAPATPLPSLPLPATQAAADISAPEGWDTYRSRALGFGFAYPATGMVAAGEEIMLATIDFAPDPATNVVREVISVSGDEDVEACSTPLAFGSAAEDLSPETIVLNGNSFLRQMHSGVAAGTSTVWVAYTTERDGRCVSLGYELRTFDPANLDPTRFPTPPATVDWRGKVQDFEAMVATFTWFR